MKKAKTVFVGMSGGVDSSLTAALLSEQGYDVVGVYMKNWSKDLPGFPCPWKEDYQDAKRVAVRLGIPLKMFDFEKEYFDKVVQYMLDGFKAGITPNPDIMCNQEIKFRLFYETAREQGADYIATGHYSRVENAASINPQASIPTSNLRKVRPSAHLTEAKSALGRTLRKKPIEVRLLRSKDENKDQTYFLYRISEDALSRTLFPLGDMTKPQVREEAAKRGLVTANKKESMGICFVGKVGIKEFLTQYLATPQDSSKLRKVRPSAHLTEAKSALGRTLRKNGEEYLKVGAIIDQHGDEIGRHDGAIFYTIGQRHGLDVGGGLPYYVTGKDMDKNEVYVTSKIDDPLLWSDTIKLTNYHWISDMPVDGQSYQVRTRHRAALVRCRYVTTVDGKAELQLEDPIRAITPGQSAVLYDGEQCLGGGIMIR